MANACVRVCLQAYDIAGGALVVAASGAVIARDSWLLSNQRPTQHAAGLSEY